MTKNELAQKWFTECSRLSGESRKAALAGDTAQAARLATAAGVFEACAAQLAELEQPVLKAVPVDGHADLIATGGDTA